MVSVEALLRSISWAQPPSSKDQASSSNPPKRQPEPVSWEAGEAGEAVPLFLQALVTWKPHEQRVLERLERL